MDEERFVAKLDKTSSPKGCWIWTAYKDRKGYGIFQSRRANRVAFEMYKGHIPDGQLVRHKCDDPSCCNPDHLELGTHQDNMNDMIERGRQANRNGELNGRAKLTEDDVREIRVLLGTGIIQKEIAERFGISQITISRIKRKQAWSYLN